MLGCLVEAESRFLDDKSRMVFQSGTNPKMGLSQIR